MLVWFVCLTEIKRFAPRASGPDRVNALPSPRAIQSQNCNMPQPTLAGWRRHLIREAGRHLILSRHRRGANANRRRRCQSLLKFSGMTVPSRQDISHISSSVLPFPVPQCPPDGPSGEMQRERLCGGSGRHLRPGEEKVCPCGLPPPPLPNNGLTRQ